jgi:hypothetical protein
MKKDTTVFDFEIAQIKDEGIREWTRKALEATPEDFWILPPSKTGKYHPRDEFCEGGTIIHSKRTFYATKVLCDSELENLDSFEIDCMLSAALLHDSGKGLPRYHAEIVRPQLREKMGDEAEKYPLILECIEAHMGRWGNDIPSNIFERIVHYADNMASKAHILMSSGVEDKLHEIQEKESREDKSVFILKELKGCWIGENPCDFVLEVPTEFFEETGEDIAWKFQCTHPETLKTMESMDDPVSLLIGKPKDIKDEKVIPNWCPLCRRKDILKKV